MAMKKSEFKDCDIYAARIAALRPFPKETLKSLRDYYRVGLTYTSNALEGNSLTESETKVVIEDGLTIGGKPLKDVYEATGHAKAYDFLYKLTKDEPVTEENILKLHRLFYGQIDKDNAGTCQASHESCAAQGGMDARHHTSDLSARVHRGAGQGRSDACAVRAVHTRPRLRDAEGASPPHGTIHSH